MIMEMFVIILLGSLISLGYFSDLIKKPTKEKEEEMEKVKK